MWAVSSHDDCSLPLLGNDVFLFEFKSFIKEVQAVIDTQELGDVVDSEVGSRLEDPGGCEESWPDLDAVHSLTFSIVKKAGYFSNLLQLL